MTEIGTETKLEGNAGDEWLTPGRFALALALLVIAAFPGVLLGGNTFVLRDFGHFGYPLAFYHRQCFWRGELPLWNPLNHCGLPFLAQWNTLTLYPLSLIYLLLPLAWSLSFFCIAHLYWGGLGMYWLAHQWTKNRSAAGLAGVIYAFNGLALNALLWPNIEATLGWLPWVIWLVQRAWQEGGKMLVWAALAGSMQMLAGGPEPILVTWLILLVLACGECIAGKTERRWLVLRFAGVGILVTLLCAVQLLPFLELMRCSQRKGDFGSADWPMPVWGWANFLVPVFRTMPNNQGIFMQPGQYWTASYYAGIGTVLLVAVALGRVRDWRVRVLAVLLCLSLVLALGNSTFLYRVCSPGLRLVRYPVKFVILTLAVAPLLAAFGFAALSGNRRSARRFEIGAVLVIFLLIGLVVWFASKTPPGQGVWRVTWENGLARAGFLFLMVLLGAALLSSSGRRRILCLCLLLVLFWFDSTTYVPTQNPTVKPSVYSPGWANTHLNWSPAPKLGQSRAMLSMFAQETLRHYVLDDPEESYLLSRLAFVADCNLLDGVPQVYGFFSVTPQEAYRASMLPYMDPNHDFAPLVDFMGVSQTTAPGTMFDWVRRPTAMPIVTAGQQPVFADDETVYASFSQTNTDFRRIVYLPPEARGAISATRQVEARVLATNFSNQEISLQCDTPATSLVVISQSHYPAWQAYVDGRSAKIWRANFAFQAVEVPAGHHEIRLAYEDKKLLLGATVSGVALLACAGIWGLAHRRIRSA